MDDELKQAADQHELGNEALGRGEHAAARQHFEAALAARRRLLGEDHADVAATLHALGTAAARAADFAAARRHFEQALAIRRKALGEEHLDVASSLSNLGNVAHALGDLAAAQACHEQALAIRRKALGEVHQDVAGSLSNLGNVACDLGDFAAGRSFYEQALAVQRALRAGEDDAVAAMIIGNLAIVAHETGDFAKARALHEQALAVRRRLLGADHPDVAGSLNGIAGAAASLADYATARAAFEEALTINTKAFGDDHPYVAGVLYNLAVVAHELGDFAQARSLHERALAIRRKTLGDEHPAVGASLTGLGNAAVRLGEYSAARNALTQALAIQRKALGEQHMAVALVLHNLGWVTFALGDYAGARTFYEQALAIFRQALGEDHPDVAASLTNVGTAAERLGDRATARRCIEEALGLRLRLFGESHPTVAESYADLGAIAHAAADYPAARAATEKALATRRALLGADHADTAASLINLAETLRCLGDPVQARALLSEALRIARLPNNVAILPEAFHAFSALLAAQLPAAAIFFGKQAVNALQQQRSRIVPLEPTLQRSFAASKARAYRHLAGLLVDAGRLAEAEQVLAMLKEEELFDLIRREASSDPRLTFAQLTRLEATWQRHGDDVAAEIAALSVEERTLAARTDRDVAAEARLGALRGLLQAAEQRFAGWLDGLVAAFATERPDRQQDIAALNLKALDAWQVDLRALGPGAALLHYLVRPDRLAIIVTTEGFRVSRDVAIGEQALNRIVHELRLAIEKRTDDVLPLAQSLYRHLIGPVAPLLAEGRATTLTIVLDGALRYAPLAALHDGERWLIERHPLALLTLAAHNRLTDRSTAPWRVAGLGVSREVPGFARLIAVTEELRAIVRDAAHPDGVFPGVVYLDEAFTEAALVDALAGHQVVHLASHFVFAPGDELASHLLLGDGGTLTLERLKDQRFRFDGVELATLSACETAMGGGREDGREVEGLGALVQSSGAKAVVATLWPVADASTATLMRVFYTMRRDGKSKAEALRAAQLHLLHASDSRFSHPFHWAPFLLMGNWR